jgi:hypothetical protein
MPSPSSPSGAFPVSCSGLCGLTQKFQLLYDALNELTIGLRTVLIWPKSFRKTAGRLVSQGMELPPSPSPR